MKNKEMYLKYKVIDGKKKFNIVENRMFEKEVSITDIEKMLKKIHNKDIDLVSISENAC